MFFDLTCSDLQLNVDKISAFATQTLRSPTDTTKTRLEVFLEGTEAHPVDDIRSAPQLTTFETKKEFLQYYDGLCVETEEARRQWQRQVLTGLSRNAQAAHASTRFEH